MCCEINLEYYNRHFLNWKRIIQNTKISEGIAHSKGKYYHLKLIWVLHTYTYTLSYSYMKNINNIMNSKIKIYFFPEVTVREKNVSHCLILFNHHINLCKANYLRLQMKPRLYWVRSFPLGHRAIVAEAEFKANLLTSKQLLPDAFTTCSFKTLAWRIAISA